jgi:hypothetical protein
MSTAGDRPETAHLGSGAVSPTLQRNALVVGAVALILCTLYGVWSPASFFRAYLMAFEFWLSVSLGCTAVMMIRHLSGGAWGLYLRPLFEAAAILMPLLALLFLPLLLGLPYLYPWREHPPGPLFVQTVPLVGGKQVWFTMPFFLGRAAAYFVLWTGLAYFLNLGRRGPFILPAGEEPPRHFRVVSGVGLVVYGLTITFAAIDWSISLDVQWFSTMYGAKYAAGQLLGGFAFAVLAATLFMKESPGQQLLRDLGNLILAFTMMWAYLSFSEYLLIWAGNLPDETAYYVPRFRDGWEWVALALVLGEFALPFLLLLVKRVKITPRLLGAVALISLIMHYVDLVWLTVPANGASPSWDLIVVAPAVLVGVGGVWLSLFLWRLRRRPFYSAAALHLEVPTYE